MFTPMMRSHEKYIVTSTKVIIETHIAVMSDCNYSERKIENTTKKSPLQKINNVKASDTEHIPSVQSNYKNTLHVMALDTQTCMFLSFLDWIQKR